MTLISKCHGRMMRRLGRQLEVLRSRLRRRISIANLRGERQRATTKGYPSAHALMTDHISDLIIRTRTPTFPNCSSFLDRAYSYVQFSGVTKMKNTGPFFPEHAWWSNVKGTDRVTEKPQPPNWTRQPEARQGRAFHHPH